MNRTGLQQFAQLRLTEARTLLQAGLPDRAYYLAGYAVECALKACIAKATGEHDFPDKALVNKSWTHDLEQLLGVAGLKQKLEEQKAANPMFAANWNVVKDWSEDTRYERHSQAKAQSYYEAVGDKDRAVLEWLKAYW